jgi:hypothetical protein
MWLSQLGEVMISLYHFRYLTIFLQSWLTIYLIRLTEGTTKQVPVRYFFLE